MGFDALAARLRPLLKSSKPVVALLFVAFAVRIWAATSALFCDDESMFWATAVDVARGTVHPEVGPPISGSPAGLPGPLFYYLSAAVQIFTPHPFAGALLVIVLNVVGLALMASAVRTALGPRASLVYLVLTVASPWTVVYADRLWPGNLFFFLCALTVFGLVRMEAKSRSRVVGLLAFVLVAGAQIHLSIAHLWFFSLVTLAWIRPRMNWRALAIGFVAGCVTYAPYLAHELRSDFSNTRLITHFAPGGERTWETLGGLFVYFFGFATTDIMYLMHDGYWTSFDPIHFWETTGATETTQFFSSLAGSHVGSETMWAWLFASVATVVFGLVFFFRALVHAPHRHGRSLFVTFFSAALVGIPVLYWLSRKGGYAHYTTIIQPLAFLPPAMALDWMLGSRLRVPAVVYLLGLQVVSIVTMSAYYARSGSPVLEQMRIVDFVEHRTDASRPFRFELRQHGGYPASYGAIAKTYWQAPWSPSASGRDRFVVTSTKETRARGPEVLDELRMTHLTVRKTR